MRIWSRLFLARGAEGGVGSCCAPSGSGAAWTRELATVTGTVASSNGNLVAKRECDAVTVTCPGSVSAVSGTLFSSRRPRHSDHRTTPTRPPRGGEGRAHHSQRPFEAVGGRTLADFAFIAFGSRGVGGLTT
ncbi:uncharacterized protein LOC144337996 isoform X2 [Macaca mulatta]